MGFEGSSPLVARGIVRAGLSHYAPGVAIDHENPAYHAVIYTISGLALSSRQDGSWILAANTLWVAPAGCSHTITVGADGWETMWFSIRRGALWRHLETARPHMRMPGQSGRMVHVMQGLISESSTPMQDNVQMGRHFAEILGIFLDRRLHRGGESTSDDMRQRLSVLWERVGRELQRAWTIDEMAAEIALSPSHLHRVVQQFHQTTPMGVLTLQRLQRAQDLLAHTGHKLEYVAHGVGYTSPFALSKAFKRHFGISPQDYRRQQRSIFEGRDFDSDEAES